MREDVKKFLFFGPEDEKESFFKKAQTYGIIHFIDPRKNAHKEIPKIVDTVVKSIKVLRGLPPTEQEENYSGLNADAIVDEILSLHEKAEALEEEVRILDIEISRIFPFANFSLEDIAYIQKEAHRYIQFYVGRPGLFHDKPMPEELIYISSEHSLEYYIAINEKATLYDKLIEMKFDRSLGDLRMRHAAARVEHHEINKQLKGFAKYNEFLHQTLIEKLNKYNLYDVQTYVQEAMSGILFAIEGWVPVTKTHELENLVDRQNVYAEEIAIEPADVIPTVLENDGLGKLGEDLIRIYDTPSSTDRDPSNWVLWCFALFFAFIIGDAGYGLIYFLIALFLQYKFRATKGVWKRVLNLFTFLSAACIVWGTLMTSFFGIQIEPDNPLRKVSLLHWFVEKKAEYIITHKNENDYKSWVKKYPELAKATTPSQFVSFRDKKGDTIILSRLSDNIMFELALCIGVIHLIISCLRYARKNPPNLGWAVFLAGGYLYIGYYLQTPTFVNFVLGISMQTGKEIGTELMIGGIAFTWLTSIFIHGWKGIFEIMVIIQVFADTLSYLRLYALGLAGAIVAGTINEIAGGLPIILGILLVVLSHFINIILGTMSGIIHGLRLNFLEWYHYSFEGGGKDYKPLKLMKME